VQPLRCPGDPSARQRFFRRAATQWPSPASRAAYPFKKVTEAQENLIWINLRHCPARDAKLNTNL
jgi:hypothetical protein